MESIMLLRKQRCEFEDLKKGEVPCIDKVQRQRDAPSRRGGFGWVARDFASIFQGASGGGDLLYESNLMAETKVIRVAVMACIDKGFEAVRLSQIPNVSWTC
ncbi:hypothetical protein D8674_010031 [Pyrus ussuriensis x Pyrus communis]|uniref:Uncharacterized protein n=1 Tax=Pyrus ussuriensis x Pyrus communis TaxID=2448454 RepID=A0A5N5FEZ7_9ROSA|nr:hypothetical protein D8674_010031 [Pyrus ussuriensis x Pyrus communis]